MLIGVPHKNMGMIGFVVVGGDKSNLDAIKNKIFGKIKNCTRFN